MNRVILTGKNHEIPRAAFSALEPSGTQPDAVAATVSRRSMTADTLHTVKRSECSPLPAATPAPKLQPPGDLLDTLQDVVTVMSGLVVFGGLAFFCLVLA